MNVTLEKFFESRRIFSNIYIHHQSSQLPPRTKNFKKFATVLRTADARQTDSRTDGWTHEHSEIINIDIEI